ncbi:hypothetical protein SIN8267_03193 [Sinobacterium norvegicum]|uniref:NolW-like domain-containing protein n=1 Tax=Sinobacterium norvegicum TaxID=1641715 RepID=A0ABM9AJ00_9GAMM|nr:secretin N-terminal domain-containing protein [Sinobacterium norvegicum]CAH0993054.1 hypothetical protein SIN8267_03193 [Sinobacterium norvegicum]
MNKTLFFLLLLLISSTAVAQRNMVTFTLNQVSAEEVAVIVRGVISPQSSVNHFQNKLIVKGTATEIDQIRTLLKTLDATGRQLWIAVKVDGGGNGSNYQQTIETSPDRHNSSSTTTTTTINQRSYSGSAGGGHGVRATEGSPAYITTGQTVAMQRVINGQTHVIEASSGFYATARVIDDSVAIEIDQQRNHLQGGTINSQQLQSRVSGGLGQWIAVGSVSGSQQSQSHGYGDRNGQQQAGAGTIYIKVDIQ